MASPKPTSSAALAKLALANNAFAIHLYQTVQDGRRGRNLFFSPLSISTALAMTQLGARGDTATQIANVFRFDQVGEYEVALPGAFKELIDLLYQSKTGYTLKAANKLYGKSGYKIVQPFLEGAESYYDSTIEVLSNFASPAAAKSINDWVSKQTEGKITNLIPPGVLDSLTRLVVVNAVYFKGKWASKFSRSKTTKDVFKVKDGRKTVPVNLMVQSGTFLLVKDKVSDCVVLEIPYQGRDLSILIALPSADDGLGQLEANLTAEILSSWHEGLKRTLVEVLIPKFKQEEQFRLREALTTMGMPDAFDSTKANFEGITGNRELHISAVIHKAFVDVNEEGCEAAAATVVAAKRMCRRQAKPVKPVLFRADHPFLFMIRHRQTNSILFMGRVMDPS